MSTIKKIIKRVEQAANDVVTVPRDIGRQLIALQRRTNNKNKNNNKSRNGNSSSSSSVAPVAYGYTTVTKRPIMRQGTGGSIRIQHSELISSAVVGSATLSQFTYFAVNPGLAGNFPWLAGVATKYEQYTIHALSYDFITSTSTGVTGEVMMVPIYDSKDLIPVVETTIMGNEGATAGPVWQNLRVHFDKKSMMGLGPRKFVRSTAVAGDSKTFDVGALAVFTNNGTTAAIGKLWVNYDIEFFSPQNDLSAVMGNSSNYFQAVLTATQTLTSGVATILGPWTLGYDPLSIYATYSAGLFTPPAGVYLIKIQAGFNDSSAESFLGNIAIYKNAAAISAAQMATLPTTGTPDQSLTCTALYNFNGTDTLSFRAFLQGAAGTLTCVAGSGGIYTQIFICLA